MRSLVVRRSTIEEAWQRVQFRICADTFHSEADRRSREAPPNSNVRSLSFEHPKGERLQSPTGRRTRIPDFTGTERESEDRVMRENDTPADKNDDAPRPCIWSLRFFSQDRAYRIKSK